MTDTSFEGWAIVELMGHRQRAGHVRETEMFGTKLLRVDTPVAEDQTVTEFYGGGSIYALRPCTEEVARGLAERLGDPRPVAPLSYRLAAPDSCECDPWDDDCGQPSCAGGHVEDDEVAP